MSGIAAVNKIKAIDTLAIRDTSEHTSLEVDNGDTVIKTLVIENILDQAVTFRCEGSANSDFSNHFDIGYPWDVPASTNIYATCNSYIPYWRIVATCASAPTSGTVTVWVMGVLHGNA